MTLRSIAGTHSRGSLARTRYVMSIAGYIEALTLSSASFPNSTLSATDLIGSDGLSRSVDRPLAAVPAAPAGVQPAPSRAAVDVGSVLSFVDGLSSTERDDVLC